MRGWLGSGRVYPRIVVRRGGGGLQLETGLRAVGITVLGLGRRLGWSCVRCVDVAWGGGWGRGPRRRAPVLGPRRGVGMGVVGRGEVVGGELGRVGLRAE